MDQGPLAARGNPEGFRKALAAWLAETVPDNWRSEQAAADEAEQVSFHHWWFGKLAATGLASAHWPASWGGAELDIGEQIIFYEELARADAPNTAAAVVSLNQVPATFFAAGSPEQKQRYVAGVLAGDIWCQGFSEPGAGSDLAAIRTTAVREGDHYRVNGQKIWTSYGHFAKYCLLLARTDPGSERHQGLSLFALEMDSPGLTVRNIRQSNGNHEFNEVYFDDVMIPAEGLIGTEGDGWKIAQATLSSERGLIIFELSERLRRFLDRQANAEHKAGDWRSDVQMRREFARLLAESEGLSALIRMMLEENADHGDVAGQFAPMFIKLFFAKHLRTVTDFFVRANGLEGQRMRPDIFTNGAPGANWMYDYITSWSWSIAGGTDEIIRTIVGERVLGLPR